VLLWLPTVPRMASGLCGAVNGLPFPLFVTQEVKHAPMVEQCRVDQKLWLSMVGGSRAGVTNVSYKELDGWFAQLSHESDGSVHYSE